MYSSCLKKQDQIKKLFSNCTTPESKYEKIMELGRQQEKLDPHHRTPENLVRGCQSAMYLHTTLEEGNLIFRAESEALISSGLAALLTQVYSGETPETLLKCPPDYLEAIGIGSTLTPSRANGLYSIHLRMKQEALKMLTSRA